MDSKEENKNTSENAPQQVETKKITEEYREDPKFVPKKRPLPQVKTTKKEEIEVPLNKYGQPKKVKEIIYESSSDESDEEIEIKNVKQKREATEGQLRAMKKAQEVRKEKKNKEIEERKRLQEELDKQKQKELEEKIIKKAENLKKRELKKKIKELDELDEEAESIDVKASIEKLQKHQQQKRVPKVDNTRTPIINNPPSKPRIVFV